MHLGYLSVLPNIFLNDSLSDWDTLGENTKELISGTKQPLANPLAPIVPNLDPMSDLPSLSPNQTNILVELQIIGLPSNKNVTLGHEHIELSLRKARAKSHLNHLHKLIAEKSFHYSNLICGALRKGVMMKARCTVKTINLQISFHCQVYSWC